MFVVLLFVFCVVGCAYYCVLCLVLGALYIAFVVLVFGVCSLLIVVYCLLFVVLGVRCLMFVDCCSRCAFAVCGWLLVGCCWLSVVAFVFGSWCLVRVVW